MPNSPQPNPHHLNQQAVAIAYETGDLAPRVVARGRGAVAEQIIERAKQHQIFVHESKDLVALLMQVDLDDHIPPALYRAIAEILAWLYRAEQQASAGSESYSDNKPPEYNTISQPLLGQSDDALDESKRIE
ncbi:MAG TPA: EscU/YscU/HrcU family type III secretion system export apparatus switch protein [Methyloradius sp.]